MSSAEEDLKLQKVQSTDENRKISGVPTNHKKMKKNNNDNNNDKNNNNNNNNNNNIDVDEKEKQKANFSWKDRLAENRNLLASPTLASPTLVDKTGGETQNPSSNSCVNSESAVAETENTSPENIFIDQIRDQVGDKTLDDGNDDDDQEVD